MTAIELTGYEVTHRHGGNGWAVVEIIDDEYCRIADKWLKGQQAYLVLTKLLTPSMLKPLGAPFDAPPEQVRLDEDDLKRLAPIREGIAKGKIKVVSTRFEKA